MTQTVGHLPAIRRFVFIDGQDFVGVFATVGASLPVGSTVSLELLTHDRGRSYGSWPATLTGDGWVVFIDAADHAGIPHGGWARLFTTYPAGGGRSCWIAGPVERNRR